MNATFPQQERIQAQKQPNLTKGLRRTLVGASLVEAISGIIAIVLTILGLSGIVPMRMGAISVIVLGVGWLFEASMLRTEYSKILRRTRRSAWDRVGSGSGFTAETVTGIAAIALGILVLLGIATSFLLPIATVVLGIGLVVTSAAVSSINSKDIGVLEGGNYPYESRTSEAPEVEGYAYESRSLEIPEEHKEREVEAVAHGALGAATGVQVVLGFAVTVLGLLALVGFSPLTFTIVSTLVAGIAALMIGSAVGGRICSVHTA